MAKDGRKLELYEILAANRAKGKVPLGLDVTAKRSGAADPGPEAADAPGIIIDDSIGEEYRTARQAETVFEPAKRESSRVAGPAAPTEVPAAPSAPAAAPAPERDSGRQGERGRATDPDVAPKPKTRREYIPLEPAAERPAADLLQKQTRRHVEKIAPPDPGPEPEPRPRSPREIVIALDTGLIFFMVVLLLVGCSYFIGYKRGQEERPAGLAGLTEIEVADPERLNLRTLAPAPRAALRPPEDGYTLIIRKEPATENDLPERLELELAEAVARGRNAAGRDVPGFIFRTVGNDPQFILAVGLGQNANDQGLNELLQVYYAMEGVTLSREPAPYRGSRIAPIRELGTPVY